MGEEREVVYVQVVETADGKYVAEGRDSNRKVVDKTKEFSRQSAAAQAGADTWPSTPDHGIEVRHAVVNDGESEAEPESEPE